MTAPHAFDGRALEITYTGADGGRHYARILEYRPDGRALVSRGYYGVSVIRLGPADDPRDYRTGRPIGPDGRPIR